MIYESDSDNETCEENSKNNENDNSTNNPSQQEREEDNNVLTNLTNKLAAININENNTSTHPKIKVGQTIDFTIDNVP